MITESQSPVAIVSDLSLVDNGRICGRSEGMSSRSVIAIATETSRYESVGTGEINERHENLRRKLSARKSEMLLVGAATDKDRRNIFSPLRAHSRAEILPLEQW